MIYKVICVIILIAEVKFGAGVRKTVFSDINLPSGFDDDKSFEKSGFMPEFDFSHFFRRVDFDRDLDATIPQPENKQRKG